MEELKSWTPEEILGESRANEIPVSPRFEGMGNIDLSKRKRVANPDGSFSTLRSMSFEEDGREILIPTLDPEGKQLSEEEAIQLYRKSGQHLGKFKTVREATAYAESLSEKMGQKSYSPEQILSPSILQNNLKSMKDAGGSLASLADIVLSTPGFLVGVGAQLGGTVRGAASGLPWQGSDVTAYTAGRKAGMEVAEPLMNPLHKLIKMFESGEAYEQASSTKTMEAFGDLLTQAGEWVEKKSGGRIAKDAVPMMAETLMASATGAGIKGAERIKPAIERAKMIEPEIRSKVNEDLYPGQRKEGAVDFEAPETRVEAAETAVAAEELLRVRTAVERAGETEQKFKSARTEPVLVDMPREVEAANRMATDQPPRVSPEALVAGGVTGIAALGGAAMDEENRLRGAMLGGAVGAAAALPFASRGRSLPRNRELGAVKAPGGMWHPKMVEYLTDRLAYGIFRRPEIARARVEHTNAGVGLDAPAKLETLINLENSVDNHAARMVGNYLNKYAGTTKDPLKDIEIPYEQGTIRWEDAWDKSAGGYPARSYVELPPGVKPDEIVWGTKGVQTEPAAAQAVSDYIAHVGDYLATVPLDKLGQYDFVRAAKETAAQDARMAKQMAEAAKANLEQLPAVKKYPDGYSWVELKLPEKLTEEQARGVKSTSGMHLPEGSTGAYVALDFKGNPIKNSYTKEIATGSTPAKAWLAGRLAEEGNAMGHCVGGYCQGVAEGESRIFSLRDPEGKSHVTVETTSEIDPVALIADIEKARGPEAAARASKIYEDSMGEGQYIQHMLESAGMSIANLPAREHIAQIKGKQNRAPIADYLPYVQDFVKSGKWGEVGDLGNTGLMDLNNLQSPPGKNVEILKQRGERFVTSKDLNDAAIEYENSRNPQSGSASTQFLTGLAAVGLGGLVGSVVADDPGWGALLGGVAAGALMLPGARRNVALAAKDIDYGLGVLSTRMRNISEPVLLRARMFEQQLLMNTHDSLVKAVPFMKELKRVKGEEGRTLTRALLNNDPTAIADGMKGRPALVAAWRDVQNLLKDYGTKLQGYGRFKDMREDYYPRVVKDVEGLKKALDIPVREQLEKTLRAAEEKAMKSRGTPLTTVEKSAIINREIDAVKRQPTIQRPGFTRGRRVEEITDALQPFYYTPQESLFMYIRAAQMDLETAKFFGKDLVQQEVGGKSFTDLNASIGNVVGEELTKGNISQAQATELISMLQSRFRGGEQGGNKFAQAAKNLGYAGLLGNIVSAATQLGDTTMAVYQSGLKATLAATARRATGGSRVTAKDFGLADHLAEEFASPSRTANWLNKVFKYSGFEAIDRFGKTTVLNAALSKAESLAKSTKGTAELAKKYERAYGDEFPLLVEDLKNGKMTDRVRAMLFSELSDLQPVSRLEVPQAYLDHPNWRMAYMLKTYMIKQFDVVRRDALQKMKTPGTRAEGIKNLAEYATILGLAGATTDMVKDWMMGRPVSFTGTDVMENALKTFGWSNYVREKMSEKGPGAAVATMVAPPYQIIDDIVRGDPRAISYIPVVGKVLYERKFGGKEKAAAREGKKTFNPSPSFKPTENKAKKFYERLK